MKFRYLLMWFDMPEYCEGNCGTYASYDTAEEAYSDMKKLEDEKPEDSIFYLVVLDETT